MRLTYFKRKISKLFANSGDPDQTPRSAASDLGLHCLRFTFLRVSRLQWVNGHRFIPKYTCVVFRNSLYANILYIIPN